MNVPTLFFVDRDVEDLSVLNEAKKFGEDEVHFNLDLQTNENLKAYHQNSAFGEIIDHDEAMEMEAQDLFASAPLEPVAEEEYDKVMTTNNFHASASQPVMESVPKKKSVKLSIFYDKPEN